MFILFKNCLREYSVFQVACKALNLVVRNGNSANFFSYVCSSRNLVVYPWNSSLICVFYACRFRCYIEGLIAAHPNKTTRWLVKKPEKVTLFPDMAIQPQVLSVYTLVSKSIIYIIMRKEKAPI